MRLSVWAPLAKIVDLVTPERRTGLHRSEDGEHWRLEAEESMLEGGYRYSIDGNAPIPDPRSHWQPNGVHGESHVVDLARLRAKSSDAFLAKPLREAVIYELHVGTFTPQGTYAAALLKLLHLQQLGVTHIELMPLATFPGQRGWGYDGVDLFAPFPAYGTPQELADFVRACHDHQIAVLLDVVYNHLGPDGNYLGQAAPYFTDQYKTPWGSAINYDGAHSEGVRQFVIDNALMWLRDYGFDGLRLDAVHAIFCFGAVHVLEELSGAVSALAAQTGRQLTLIAESDLNDPRIVRDAAHGGFGIDAHWEDDFHHALHRFFTGEATGYYEDFRGLPDLATALREGYVYQGQRSAHRRRNHGRAPTGVAADQLIVSAQNHDQIGNRAQGERLSMMLDVPQLKAIAAMTLLSPFVPLLFQGEEWGATTPFLYFTDHENQELGRLVAEGRAKEFSSFAWAGEVPNPQAAETFERSRLDWAQLAAPRHADLFNWHRQLIRLRRETRVAVRGKKPTVKFDEQALWLRFAHGPLLALFNLSPQPQTLRKPGSDWHLVLRSEVSQGSRMAPFATHIYRRPE